MGLQSGSCERESPNPDKARDVAAGLHLELVTKLDGDAAALMELCYLQRHSEREGELSFLLSAYKRVHPGMSLGFPREWLSITLRLLKRRANSQEPGC